MTIDINEYDVLLRKYLDEHGPNPGKGYFGSYGWYATMKNQFDESLRDGGIEVKGLNQKYGN